MEGYAGVRLEVGDGKLMLNADADVVFEIGANSRVVVPRFDVNP